MICFSLKVVRRESKFIVDIRLQAFGLEILRRRHIISHSVAYRLPSADFSETASSAVQKASCCEHGNTEVAASIFSSGTAEN